jgi:hypothetical protein
MISDKDKEAFDKWCVEKFNIAPELIEDFRFSFTHKLIHTESAWQAALEYKEAEIIELKKKVQMNIHNSAFNGLLAENKKLREALEKIACNFSVDYRYDAREALKEVDIEKNHKEFLNDNKDAICCDKYGIEPCSCKI